jgi:cobalt-zinc-cadmium efflux system outer membrane protein
MNRAYVLSEVGSRTHRVADPERARRQLSIPPGTKIEDGISEDDAVALALWNNAAFQEALAKTGFSRADLVQAGLLANPTFAVLFPIDYKPLEYTASLPVEALWLRPRRVAIARLDAERVAEALVQNGVDLVRDVRWAYSDLALARDRVRLTDESLQIRSGIAAIAEARLRAGDASEWETTVARVDALQAREDLSRLRADAALAQNRLLHLIGLADSNTPHAFGDPPAVPANVPDLDELSKEALSARPDLRAAELGMEAAGKRAGLAKHEIIALSAQFNAKGSETHGMMYGPGLSLPIPVFNRNQAGTARAKAELEQAAWGFIRVRDRILLDVREAHARFRQAAEDVRAWQGDILPPLKTAAVQAARAYEVGDVAYLAVLESARQLLSARVREAESKAELRRAAADLDRSVGQRRMTSGRPADVKVVSGGPAAMKKE